MPDRPLIFLDIDGVLNGHLKMRRPECGTILNGCVRELNRVVRVTHARIVLSSTWRDVVHTGTMTLSGFGYMLHTHGGVGLNPVGLTAHDARCPYCGQEHYRATRRRLPMPVFVPGEDCPRCAKCGSKKTRGAQISRWLSEHTRGSAQYVCIDDEDDGIVELGHPLILTHSGRGLTSYKANQAIRALRGEVPSA